MKRLLTVAFVALISLAQAQHQDTRKISKFSAISASAGIQVKFIKSSKNEVVVDVSREDILPLIETKVQNDELNIRIKRGSNIRNAKSLKVTVYSSSIVDNISLSSAASLEILEAIDVNKFTVDLSSSGKLSTGKVSAQTANINLSSSGKMNGQLKTESLSIKASSSGEVKLSGVSKTLNVNVSSNGQAHLGDFQVADVVVNGSSGGKIKINVSNSITANVSSGAEVEYSGNPKNKNVNKSSGGTVTQI